MCLAVAAASCDRRPVELGFWIEPVTYRSPRIGDPVTPADLVTIETIARSEIVKAFAPFAVTISGNRNARYRVRVVQELQDETNTKRMSVAGESRAVAGFGGSGAVSFDFLAAGAISYSTDDVSRDGVIEAIGRGIARAAVHEFAHQLLPHDAIHDTRDAASYENGSAARPAQYAGDIHWDIAAPLLQKRLGSR